MAKDKDDKRDRRAFLEGAVLAGAAVALTGTPALAQPARGKKKWAVPSPHDAEAFPEDDLGEAGALVKAASHEAMAAAEKALEKVIRAEETPRSLDVAKALAAEGLKLKSPGARKAAATIQVPDIIIKKAKEAKAKGWHAHSTWSCHADVSW